MNEELATIVTRNSFYKDGVHRLMIGLIFSLLVNIVAIFAMAYIYTHPPAPVYFATSSNGRISPLYPLDQPNTSDAVVREWANLATVAAYSYNFVNYRTELQAASEFFTGDGWDTFLNALKESNNLEAVVSKKLVVSAVAKAAPSILQKGVLNGRYAWRIQIPLLVTYQSAIQFTPQDILVTLTIVRVSTLNNPKGIGIDQFVSAPYNSGGTTQ